MGTEATSEPDLRQRLLALLLEKGYDRLGGQHLQPYDRETGLREGMELPESSEESSQQCQPQGVSELGKEHPDGPAGGGRRV